MLAWLSVLCFCTYSEFGLVSKVVSSLVIDHLTRRPMSTEVCFIAGDTVSDSGCVSSALPLWDVCEISESVSFRAYVFKTCYDCNNHITLNNTWHVATEPWRLYLWQLCCQNTNYHNVALRGTTSVFSVKKSNFIIIIHRKTSDLILKTAFMSAHCAFLCSFVKADAL